MTLSWHWCDNPYQPVFINIFYHVTETHAFWLKPFIWLSNDDMVNNLWTINKLKTINTKIIWSNLQNNSLAASSMLVTDVRYGLCWWQLKVVNFDMLMTENCHHHHVMSITLSPTSLLRPCKPIRNICSKMALQSTLSVNKSSTKHRSLNL